MTLLITLLIILLITLKIIDLMIILEFSKKASMYFGLIEMLIFIFILLIGLIYAIRKDVLKWE